MEDILKLAAGWICLSVPVSLLIARLLAVSAGRTHAAHTSTMIARSRRSAVRDWFRRRFARSAPVGEISPEL